MSDAPQQPDPDDDVPHVPRPRRRGFFFYFPHRQLVPLAALVIALIAILALRQSCAQGVAQLYRSMEPPPDGGPSVSPAEPAAPPPGPPIEVRSMAPR
jgi:hypothetical protein